MAARLAKSVTLEHNAIDGIFLGDVDCVLLPISFDHCLDLLANGSMAAKVSTEILSSQNDGQ